MTLNNPLLSPTGKATDLSPRGHTEAPTLPSTPLDVLCPNHEKSFFEGLISIGDILNHFPGSLSRDSLAGSVLDNDRLSPKGILQIFDAKSKRLKIREILEN